MEIWEDFVILIFVLSVWIGQHLSRRDKYYIISVNIKVNVCFAQCNFIWLKWRIVSAVILCFWTKFPAFYLNALLHAIQLYNICTILMQFEEFGLRLTQHTIWCVKFHHKEFCCKLFYTIIFILLHTKIANPMTKYELNLWKSTIT